MSAAYLVQFGRSAFVGRFRADDPEPVARGERVVVRGPRGLELGTVLCEPADRFTGEDDGDLLRPAAPADLAAADRAATLGRDILAAAEAGAAALPLSFVDSEVSLDGAAAVLHVLPWGACDASPLFAALSDRFGLPVRLLDLSRPVAAKDPPDPTLAKCSKPGCGTDAGGCSSCGTGSAGGCSTGSCSQGKVKTAGELTAYFTDLRRKMEASSRTPLV